MNTVILTGRRIAKELELKYTSNGKRLADYTSGWQAYQKKNNKQKHKDKQQPVYL